MRAAPELEVLYADMTLGACWVHGVWTELDFDAALQMLRREGRFKALRLGHLIVGLREDDAEAAVELMAALPNHGATLGLELLGWYFDDWPGVLDAVVTATLASRLTTLVLNACDLGPIAAPALPRLRHRTAALARPTPTPHTPATGSAKTTAAGHMAAANPLPPAPGQHPRRRPGLAKIRPLACPAPPRPICYDINTLCPTTADTTPCHTPARRTRPW